MKSRYRQNLQAIKAQFGDYKNVCFITQVLDKVQVSLIESVDTFVSLHRAERFGLVMAEAMFLGTAGVATD